MKLRFVDKKGINVDEFHADSYSGRYNQSEMAGKYGIDREQVMQLQRHLQSLRDAKAQEEVQNRLPYIQLPKFSMRDLLGDVTRLMADDAISRHHFDNYLYQVYKSIKPKPTTT